MKINIGTYELDIRARYNGERRYSEKVTMDFLNTLSLLYGYAAELVKIQYPEIGRANFYRNPAQRIFKALDAEGFYDDVRKPTETDSEGVSA